MTRATTTLIGAAVAGFLLWAATWVAGESLDAYWAFVGLCAAAGLVMALSQLVGGWTKWGRPAISPAVFLLGFLPVLIAGGLVLLAGQPDEGAFGQGWGDDLGLGWLVEDLSAVIAAIAFGIGLTFGFTLDTTADRVREDVVDRDYVHDRDYDARDRDYVRERDYVADEPVAAEREHVGRSRAHPAHDRSAHDDDERLAAVGARSTDETERVTDDRVRDERPRRRLFRR